ncbi:hypothetical protein L210DRAFT_2205832 [Boletus edulis BED1]|uniref:Uncharacterized protein n=1 Tax=Boletus edulis BED1 TaxID=1328754 RepID=A0AAD4BDV3_BOLED|nr:hypothetical protein L210DRAFT_2205832 [Boletus edulis BED1]
MWRNLEGGTRVARFPTNVRFSKSRQLLSESNALRSSQAGRTRVIGPMNPLNWRHTSALLVNHRRRLQDQVARSYRLRNERRDK